jgi:hypothetical protein
VIFDNVVHHQNHGPTIEQDLSLLTTTVTYFADMRSQMRLLACVCSKLQHTAAVFLHLAQTHVRHKPRQNPAAKRLAHQNEPKLKTRRAHHTGL